MVRLQQDPIRIEPLIEATLGRADGAVASFVGTVRDHNQGRRVRYLEYTAYPEMARAEMARLRSEALARPGVGGVTLVHRLGRLEIGEASVAIVVVGPHRAEALETCRWLIDELKRTVPIWKKEFFEGGEVWVEGCGTSHPTDQA